MIQLVFHAQLSLQIVIDAKSVIFSEIMFAVIQRINILTWLLSSVFRAAIFRGISFKNFDIVPPVVALAPSVLAQTQHAQLVLKDRYYKVMFAKALVEAASI